MNDNPLVKLTTDELLDRCVIHPKRGTAVDNCEAEIRRRLERLPKVEAELFDAQYARDKYLGVLQSANEREKRLRERLAKCEPLLEKLQDAVVRNSPPSPPSPDTDWIAAADARLSGLWIERNKLLERLSKCVAALETYRAEHDGGSPRRGPCQCSHCDAARAALAKARGET